MQQHLSWRVHQAPSAADLERVAHGVVSRGRRCRRATAVGLLCSRGRSLGWWCRRPIEFNRLFIQYLWVLESHRRQGIGTNLLFRIEQAARELNCTDALVETLSDRTAQMYRRLGYAPLAEIANYIPGYTRHVLLKQVA